MTDQTSNDDIVTAAKPSDDQTEEPSIFDQPQGTDWFLAYLIRFADDYQIEQGISLIIGGTFISGTLISGRRYFEELGKQIASANVTGTSEGGVLAETLATAYSQWKEIYPDPASEDKTLQPKTYIHLKNARVFAPNAAPMPSGAGMVLRLKLDAVDGFTLGEFSNG